MIPARKRKILCTWLIAVNLLFIWGNSLLPGTESGNLSGGVLALINSFLGLGEEGAAMLHLLIRKGAHFTEFACLGALLCWFFGMTGEKSAHLVCMPLLFGLLSACVDETIQVFTPDRGPSLIDVWIDTAGVSAGIIFLLIGYHYVRKHNKS